MSKELNIYTIVEYRGYTKRVLNNVDEYNDMINKIKKHNRKANEKRFYGNVSKKIIDGRVYATIHAYNKLTPKMQISKLDEMTSLLSEKELIEKYKDRLETKSGFVPDLNIAYFKDKNQKTEDDFDILIRYTPILYKEDLKYFDINYITNFINYCSKINDFNFFIQLGEYFYSYKSKEVLEAIHELDSCLNNIMDYDLDNGPLTKLTLQLLDSLTIETNKDGTRKLDSNGKYIISRKRLRDFAYFIKYYEQSYIKMAVPTMYNKNDLLVNCNQYNEPEKLKVRNNEYTLEELEERIIKEQEQIHEEQEYDKWDLELRKRR